MTRLHEHIDIDQRGEVCCVRLCHRRLDEPMIYELAGELRALVEDDVCRKMALSLGPDAPECMYSIFLAKLITLQRLLRERQGELVLCHVQPMVRDIFAACGLDQLFEFVPDFEAALARWTA
jgi:anti-anti-sigma factor